MIDPIRQPFHALTLQPHRRAEPRAARGAFGRCVRGGDDLARARSPRAGRRSDTFGARARRGAARDRAAIGALPHELSDAGYLLAGSASPARSPREKRSRPRLDARRFSMRSVSGAVLDGAVGRISYLPRRAHRVLGQHPAVGDRPAADLAPRGAGETDQGRHGARDRGCDLPADYDRPDALRGGGCAVRDQHVLEHRLHRAD